MLEGYAAPVQAGSETMQFCSPCVLTQQNLPVATQPVASSSNCKPGLVSWMPLLLANTRQHTCSTEVSDTSGSALYGLLSTSRPPPPSTLPCHLLNQTSGPQSMREHFGPVMPTYSLILSTHIKSSCLLEILFLAETFQPRSEGK